MEESHAKLRDRPCLEDRPSAARGLYLQGSACCSEARVLFKCFPFGECGNPATLVVWRFQGQDKYSRLKEEGLFLTLGEDVCEEIRGKVNEPEGYLPALRWAARGLSAEDASRKANVDLEVSANCR